MQLCIILHNKFFAEYFKMLYVFIKIFLKMYDIFHTFLHIVKYITTHTHKLFQQNSLYDKESYNPHTV